LSEEANNWYQILRSYASISLEEHRHFTHRQK
jgi:hypothetical protein